MQQAIINFVNEKDNGLCLIDMPTGSGKTYKTRKIIGDYIKGEILKDIPMIIYLTPLRKNIDDIYNELRLDFKNEIDLFDENVLRIHANYECVLESFLEIDEQISITLKRKDSYRNLKSKIQTHKNLEENNNIPKEILSTSLLEIRRDYEPKFRKDLEDEMSSLAKTLSERKKLLANEYKWVREVYPSCLTDERKVLFMTMDKFLSGNDPIITKSYRFISHSRTKKSLIFIDEFDATKDVILHQEIQNCKDYKLDLARLFSSISTSLKGKEFPSQLFEVPLDESGINIAISSFRKMKEKILQVEKLYNLNYVFKLEARDSYERYFIFDNYQLHTIGSNKDGKISCITDKKKNQNIISIINKESDDNGDFYRAIYAMKGALNYFINCCSILSNNYLNNYNKIAKEKKRDLMEIEQAVSTVIDPFNLDKAMAETISRMIVDNITLPIDNKKKDILSSDFYMDGFRYYDFKDDISHDASTSFLMCYLNNTSEKILLSLADKARIVGLSATASIQTVTGNYNIEYLKDKLGDKYYELHYDDLERIKFDVITRIRGDYSIFVKTENCSFDSIEEIVSNIFNKKENIEKITALLTNYKDKNLFQHRRLAKTILAIKDFLENKFSKVILVLTNKNLRTNGRYDIYSLENLKDIISALSEEANVDVPKIHYLYGGDFEKEKKLYNEEVRNGEKIILFSSYPSVGTGQNLQYEDIVENKIVEKDIDSIYIEYPTNVLVNGYSLKEETDLLKYIYQMESLVKNGELEINKEIHNIKCAFKKFNNPSEEYKVNLHSSPYNSISVNNHIIKILVQAIGRICRTNNKIKKHDVNIYIDSEIYDKVDFTPMRNRLLNPEFVKLIDNSKKIGYFNLDENMKLNKAFEKNVRIKKRIENILSDNRESWNEKDMEQWRKIREIVLKYPTISRRTLEKLINETKITSLKDFYLQCPNKYAINSYLYKENDNNSNSYENPIEYCDANRNHSKRGFLLINERNSRLTAFMRIPEVKREFEEKHYATKFNNNDFIILPYIYQSIYKGALGEEVGKILLKEIGVEVLEINDPNKFEKFDYYLKDNENIYIDFKNWSETNKKDINVHNDLNRSANKLDKIHGEKVYIINLVASELNIHDNGKTIEISTLTKLNGECIYKLDINDQKRILQKIFNK